MARILIMGVPGHGHVNPTLPVVSRLVEQGVEVIYYNTAEFRAKIAATGVDFRAYPDVGLTADVIAQAVNISLVNVTQILFKVSLTLTDFMLREIEREQPDILIFDSICLWGMQAARLTRIPSIASITTFVQEGAKVEITWRDKLHLVRSALPKLPQLLKLRSALIKRYGKDSLPQGAIFPARGDLNIVYTARELQPETPFINENFRFVGPSLAARTKDKLLALPDTRPLIYISLGTIHHTNHEFFDTCFAAFADHPGYFVLSAGAQAASLNAPANFLVREQVPQLEVLERADLFITHAGMNSLQEALYFGVPMVLVPRQMEQAMNARIAQMHGVGLVLADRPPYGKSVTSANLRAALDRVLADGRYREAADTMRAALHQTGGAAQAAAEILRFAEERTAA